MEKRLHSKLRIRASILVVGFCLAALAACAGGVSAPKGVDAAPADVGVGVSSDSLERTHARASRFSDKGRVAWSKDISAGSSPCELAYAKGTVFAHEGGVFQAHLHALDATTGTERWVKTFDGESGFAVQDDAVFVTNTFAGSDLVALRTSDGTQLWKTALPDKDGWGLDHVTAPLPVKDVIYVEQQLQLSAVDARTGKLLWNASHTKMRSMEFVPLHSQDFLVTPDRFHFMAYDLAAKKMQWTSEKYAPKTQPLIANGSIVFFGERWVDGRDEEGWFALDLKTGNLAWEMLIDWRKIVPVAAQLAYSDGVLVYRTATELVALNLADRSRLWKKHLPTTKSPMRGAVITNGNVLVASDFGFTIYALKTGEARREYWDRATGTLSLVGMPVIGDTQLYLPVVDTSRPAALSVHALE